MVGLPQNVSTFRFYLDIDLNMAMLLFRVNINNVTESIQFNFPPYLSMFFKI